MPKLIKDRKIVDDQWVVLKPSPDTDKEERESDLLKTFLDHQGRDVIVPLCFWQSQQKVISEHEGQVGVWLDSNELPEALTPWLKELPVIALNFPVFSDGRPYSSARELRNNLHYVGELRAIGDVLRDQLYYMRRCGFDSFCMREDQNLEAALDAFDDFHEGYQASVDRPVPLFKRLRSKVQHDSAD